MFDTGALRMTWDATLDYGFNPISAGYISHRPTYTQRNDMGFGSPFPDMHVKVVSCEEFRADVDTLYDIDWGVPGQSAVMIRPRLVQATVCLPVGLHSPPKAVAKYIDWHYRRFTTRGRQALSAVADDPRVFPEIAKDMLIDNVAYLAVAGYQKYAEQFPGSSDYDGTDPDQKNYDKIYTRSMQYANYLVRPAVRTFLDACGSTVLVD